MGRVLSLFRDGLANALTGVGTARDPRRANQYISRPLTQQEIANAYSGSGLLKKIVRIPADDMVREWRDWSGLDADQSAKLYEHEKTHSLRQKVQQVEVLRGLGGGALILGLPGLPHEPAPAKVGVGGLAFVNAVSRWHLSFDRLQDDARLPGYGEPAMWKLMADGGQQTLHPSRVIPFRADTSAAMAMPSTWSNADAFWGESTVQQVLDAVQDSDTARASFAALMHKARTLRFGIRGLYEMIAAGKEQQIQDRIALFMQTESIHNALIHDAGDMEGKGGETINDATYSFVGAKDLINVYAEFVAAISDIPATRLLGRAPDGMNSSGESQQADWNKKVRAMQTLNLGPCLDRLDRYLVPSALGTVPDTVAYDFAPLDTPDQSAVATRFKTQMEAVTQLQNTGAIPEREFARGVQSLLTEEGYLPELEAALAELSDDERYGFEQATDPHDIANSGKEVDPNLAGNGEPIGSGDPSRAAMADATPRPLYVRRDLLNAADLVKWAKANGFDTTLAADDMHVTVLYSRSPVDPMKMGEAWFNEDNGGIIIKPGGPRALEQFDGGAVVLQFASYSLCSRHRDMIEAGGSHDYGEYLPHITITYTAPNGLDLAKITPFAGELRFGPEIFEPLDLDWKSKIEEA